MEKELCRLMDFLRFRGDARLVRLAAEAEERYGIGAQALDDEELGGLFAAGDSGRSAAEGEDDDR